jgi:hypothetical protein
MECQGLNRNIGGLLYDRAIIPAITVCQVLSKGVQGVTLDITRSAKFQQAIEAQQIVETVAFPDITATWIGTTATGYLPESESTIDIGDTILDCPAQSKSYYYTVYNITISDTSEISNITYVVNPAYATVTETVTGFTIASLQSGVTTVEGYYKGQRYDRLDFPESNYDEVYGTLEERNDPSSEYYDPENTIASPDVEFYYSVNEQLHYNFTSYKDNTLSKDIADGINDRLVVGKTDKLYTSMYSTAWTIPEVTTKWAARGTLTYATASSATVAMDVGWSNSFQTSDTVDLYWVKSDNTSGYRSGLNVDNSSSNTINISGGTGDSITNDFVNAESIGNCAVAVQNPFTHNTSCWAADLDFTGVSPWNSEALTTRSATLITRKHILQARHWSYWIPGTTVIFVDKDENVYRRYVVNALDLYPHDCHIWELDSELPSSIKHYAMLPTNTWKYVSYNYLFRPLAWCTQDRGFYATSVNIMNGYKNEGSEAANAISGASLIGNINYLAYESCHTQMNDTSLTFNTQNHNDYFTALRSGDSGGPMFVFLDNEPVLYALGSSTPVQSLPDTDYNQVVEFLSPYALEYKDLSGYTQIRGL